MFYSDKQNIVSLSSSEVDKYRNVRMGMVVEQWRWGKGRGRGEGEGEGGHQG